MLPKTLEGRNLGERHKCFNKLVKEAISNQKQINADDLRSEDEDVHNLINIDVANFNKDVDYIMKVLTCNDILYVKRAIKNCSWLVSDNKYASIVNPEYLNSKLYPFMESKAVVMFKELLRNNINNELRAEQFYDNEQKPSDAVKWLPKCSVEFIEKQFNKQFSKNADTNVIKRLCEKSIIFLELSMKCDIYNKQEIFEKTLFLIHTDVNKYLDILESQTTYNYPNFGKRATKLLMKECPHRILDKFGKYCGHIDITTFLKYLKKEDLKDFLLKEAVKVDEENNDVQMFLYNTRNWYAFCKALPKNDIFPFIKLVFIDELEEKKEHDYNDLEKAIITLRRVQNYTPIHYWYQFVPFELAFSDIKSMLGPETDTYDKGQMFESLAIATKGNLEHAKCLLQYFQDKHMTSPLEVKSQLMNNLISKCDTHRFDKESWTCFNDIIDSMDIFNDLQSNHTIIEACIVYKILNSEIIHEKLEKAFAFNSLKHYQNKLNANEKDLIFNCLEQMIWKTIKNCKTTDKAEFQICLDSIKTMLLLLKDWEKDIVSYPQLLDKIRDLLKIKKDQSWDINMSSLYNLKKTWRKHMFNESIALSPTEEVCINSLKHDPNLLKSYKLEVESMFYNDSVLLRRFLRKVRIYWPQTFGKDCKENYLDFLNRSDGHKALTKGLCFLLSKSQLSEVLMKYLPKDAKIDWDQINEHELSLQRCFAKNMHRARPQPSIETVLQYSKGDYLQYALPSLLAIFYNSSLMQFEVSLPNLLYTPVSLQKHVLRFAFIKLSSGILKETLRALWKNTQNTTIRTEIFTSTHKLLCKEQDEEKVLDTWTLLEMFIDNLTFEENKAIYKLLYSFGPIPQTIKANYLVKCYNFLKTLIADKVKEYCNDEWDLRILARQSSEVMESLPSHFVVSLISEYISEKFFKDTIGNKADMSILSSYLLCAKDEDTQLKRYEEVFKAIQQRSFESWNDRENQQTHINKNYELLVYCLINDFKRVVVGKGMIVPVKMFSEIQMEMEKSLPVPENYILLRTWQLTTQLVTLLDRVKPIDWDKSTLEIAPEFGRICCEYLKNDTKSYFPCIYMLFTRVLKIVNGFLSEDVRYRILESLVQTEDFIPGYLAVLKFANYIQSKEKWEILERKIRNHSSIEVKMHYYDTYKSKRAVLFPVS